MGLPGHGIWATQALEGWAGGLEKRSSPGGEEGLNTYAPGRPARADGSALPLCCRNETLKWSWGTITFWIFRVRAAVGSGSCGRPQCPLAPQLRLNPFLRDEVVCGWLLRLSWAVSGASGGGRWSAGMVHGCRRRPVLPPLPSPPTLGPWSGGAA